MAKKKQPKKDELQELDEAYVSITGYTPKRLKTVNKRRVSLLGLCILLALLLVLSGLFIVAVRHTTVFDQILPMDDVTIGGLPLQGMTKAEAKAALNALAGTYLETPMVITAVDTTLELSPEDTGIAPDMESAVDDAFRDGITGQFDLIPYLNLDLNQLRGAAESLGKRYNTELSQTVAAITGQRPALESGSAEEEKGMTLSITVGFPAYGLDVEALYQQILDGYNRAELEVTAQWTQVEPQMPDLDTLYQQTFIAPVDAVMDPVTFEISPDSFGYHFDLEAAKAALETASYEDVIAIPFRRIAPTVTMQQLSATLFCDLLGEAETPYKGNDTNNRNTNIAIACEAINGLVLLPGESFSYNDTLGERTAEAGYKEAPSYVNGLTVDTLGGGICQVSSTLYYSTLFADLEILERHNHGYVSDYIPKGMDATVTWDGADFRFSNNTNYPIRIEAWRADGKVHVQIYGTDERDYYVKMSYKVLESTPYETVYEEYPSDNPKGYKEGSVVVTPYKGYIVQTYKEKYSKETDELISKEKHTYDVYKKRDQVICKIVDPVV